MGDEVDPGDSTLRVSLVFLRRTALKLSPHDAVLKAELDQARATLAKQEREGEKKQREAFKDCFSKVSI